MLTEAEQVQLATLIERQRTKFQEIVQSLAQTRGPGADLQAEAERALEEWNIADVDGELPPFKSMTPFQWLLNECHQIGEQILDIKDSAIERGIQ